MAPEQIYWEITLYMFHIQIILCFHLQPRKGHAYIHILTHTLYYSEELPQTTLADAICSSGRWQRL